MQYISSQMAGFFAQNLKEGWSGFTISQISGKADRILSHSLNLVLLLSGTNDTVRQPHGTPARLQALLLLADLSAVKAGDLKDGFHPNDRGL